MSIAEELEQLKQNTVEVVSEAELAGKVVIGVLVDRERPIYNEEYGKLVGEELKV